MNKISLLLIQPILPRYRIPLFLKLAQSPLLDLTLAVGQTVYGEAQESLQELPGVKIVPLHTVLIGKRPSFFYKKGLLSHFNRNRHQVIIAEFNPRDISIILTWLYARLKGTKFIWWGHGIGPRCTKSKSKMLLGLADAGDAMIFYDAVRAEQYIAWGLPKDKVFVAANTIDVETISRLYRKGSREERQRILFIGRLIPSKKADLAIYAFALAVDRLRPEIRLTIIGDGPERPRLEALAEKLALRDRVEFIGAIYDDELLAPWFNSSWVSVATGYVGLNAMHSLAFGLPMLVARDEPHSPELVALEEGVNCLFFPSDDAQSLAEQLIQLSQNPGEIERLTDAAWQTVHGRFTISTMVTAFEQAVCYALDQQVE